MEMAKYRACIIPELSDKPFNAMKASLQYYVDERHGLYEVFLLVDGILHSHYITHENYEHMMDSYMQWSSCIGKAIFRGDIKAPILKESVEKEE